MELKDTVNLMLSDDYKERFKAEYLQTKIRYEKLYKLVIQMEAKNANPVMTLEFEPTTPFETLKAQMLYMQSYLYELEIRAVLEGVDLSQNTTE